MSPVLDILSVEQLRQLCHVIPQQPEKRIFHAIALSYIYWQICEYIMDDHLF